MSGPQHVHPVGQIPRRIGVEPRLGASADPLYYFMGGTSMATPLVAGCMALAREFSANRPTNPSANPSAALVKALLIGILVQSRRDQHAAKRFFHKLLKGLRYVPRVIVTDPLKSDEAARKERIPEVEHRPHQGLNNRAERSHPPTRRRLKPGGG